MEVLVRGLREVVFIHYTRVDTHFIHDHFVIKLICVAAICSQVVADEVLRFSLAVRHAAGREIVVLVDNITSSKNLRFSTEVLLMILRKVINRSLLLVKRAQILIVVRILMIIE